MPSKALVLDANILIRAVLGNAFVAFSSLMPITSPSSSPKLRTGKPRSTWQLLWSSAVAIPRRPLRLLRSMAALGTVMTRDIYADFETEARKRLASRDPDDWPILAAALALGCPIWTEDTDFFGCGVATWTSASIGSFLTQ